ncbi:hypothetical protein FACS189472_11210 [Alphaproteobacteria bacterium]|nr:hypothetical protein FACS189472_11210 [Alphaproteobacteria bacterium]
MGNRNEKRKMDEERIELPPTQDTIDELMELLGILERELEVKKGLLRVAELKEKYMGVPLCRCISYEDLVNDYGTKIESIKDYIVKWNNYQTPYE